jgi:hypothetical protein
LRQLELTKTTSKWKQAKVRVGDVIQAIECLPSKCKAQSSNPSPNIKKKKKGVIGCYLDVREDKKT